VSYLNVTNVGRDPGHGGHFKNFNDQHGHPAGDRLLRAAAKAWAARLRRTDTLARYGGEEFIVLFTTTPADAAVAVEHLREVTPDGQTFSAGIAAWNGAESGDALVARADRALYDAKRSGRNRSMIAVGGESSSPVEQPTSPDQLAVGS
jgi:diguanylate cyclase (GGDEF)-like protein